RRAGDSTSSLRAFPLLLALVRARLRPGQREAMAEVALDAEPGQLRAARELGELRRREAAPDGLRPVRLRETVREESQQADPEERAPAPRQVVDDDAPPSHTAELPKRGTELVLVKVME